MSKTARFLRVVLTWLPPLVVTSNIILVIRWWREPRLAGAYVSAAIAWGAYWAALQMLFRYQNTLRHLSNHRNASGMLRDHVWSCDKCGKHAPCPVGQELIERLSQAVREWK